MTRILSNPKGRDFALLALLFAALLAAERAPAQELVLLSADEAGRILGREDEFVARMSPFDRSARLKTDRTVSTAEYLAFAASDTREWEDHEQASIQAAYDSIRPALVRLGLPLPERISVIKTSGIEAQYAAYTRGTAIVFPAKVVGAPGQGFKAFLAHELFHISSRANPGLAKALYHAIGFEYCGDVRLPADLAPRAVTNPDAPRNDHCIEVTVDGTAQWVVPILFSRSSAYVASQGKEYLDYIQFKLLVVDRSDGVAVSKPAPVDGMPWLLDVSEVSGFYEQVGNNTGYVIHPEEIVADNFAMLVIADRDVPSPGILARMQEILARD